MNFDQHSFSRGLLALAVALTAGCGGGGPPGGELPPVPVDVAEVVVRNVTEWDEFSGRIEAVERVDVRPRVTGYLDAVHFDDGAIVAAGDLLFSIDTREYEAARRLASANRTRAQTRVKLAEQEMTRGEKLLAAKAISAEEFDSRTSELEQAKADLSSAEAELAQARLNLEFTQLRAPIDGRVGKAQVRPGNLVAAGESLLTTIVSIDPVHVLFEGDERVYLKYQAQAAAGARPSSRNAANPVQVGLASDSDYPYAGSMDFVDNVIDPATGTIQGRAVLPNPDGLLIPGLFARVRLLGSAEFEAILVNDMAILTDQDRQYVYVIDQDNRAQRRDVILGRKVDGLRIIESGLSAGERIVVNGVRKIFFPGAPVQPTRVPMDTAESASDADEPDA
ncbi:MAG: efflux RND transporter periplasmic adaptor subunit [Pseudomonadota bacterium]